MIPFNRNHNPMELDVINLTLQMRKLKLGRGVKRLALGPAAGWAKFELRHALLLAIVLSC